MSLKPHAGIVALSPYIGGDATIAGDDALNLVRMMSNENPYGCSEAVKHAFRDMSSHFELYPSSGHGPLRQAIGEVHGVSEGRIVCGNGSDNLIHMTCQAYLQPGDEVLYTKHGFLVYPIATQACGGVPVMVSETLELRADLDALLSAVTPKTKIVFLANPNNPTGTYIAHQDLVTFRQKLPQDILLVIDSAYAEYAEAPDYDAGVRLADAFDNVLMIRTFSKAYGLAALRLGWGYGTLEIIHTLQKTREPFNLNVVAQVCGEVAVRDQAFVAFSRQNNTRVRSWLAQELGKRGYDTVPSQTNFLLWHVGPDAKEVYEHLCHQGVYIRRVKAYHLPEHLRITIGTEAQCQRFLDALDTNTITS
jgi:histidinol-phosphate aminotransferase